MQERCTCTQEHFHEPIWPPCPIHPYLELPLGELAGASPTIGLGRVRLYPKLVLWPLAIIPPRCNRQY